MVVPANAPGCHEICSADGQVFAVLLSPDEFARMEAETVALREQVKTLQRQKDYYVAELTEILKTWVPIPPTEEELLSAVPNSHELRELIAEIESR